MDKTVKNRYVFIGSLCCVFVVCWLVRFPQYCRLCERWHRIGRISESADDVVKCVVTGIRMDDVEHKYGRPIRNRNGVVMAVAGDVFAPGIIISNLTSITETHTVTFMNEIDDGVHISTENVVTNLSKYDLWQYHCVDGIVDVVATQGRVLWRAKTKLSHP